MTLQLFRYMHFSEEGIGKTFKDLLKQCDILFIESVAKEGYEYAKGFYNDLSFKGHSDRKLKYEDLGGFEVSFHSLIRNCKKHVEVEKSPITLEEADRWKRMSESSKETFLNGNFEKAYQMRLKETKYFAKLNERRDTSLEGQLVKLQEQNPGKNILFPFGGGHLTYMKLKNKGVDIRQTLSNTPLIMDNKGEFMRRTMLGLSCPKELIARTFSDDIVFTYLYKIGVPLAENWEKTRETSEKLSLEDLKELSEHIGRNVHRRKMPVEASIIWLRKKGIEI